MCTFTVKKIRVEVEIPGNHKACTLLFCYQNFVRVCPKKEFTYNLKDNCEKQFEINYHTYQIYRWEFGRNKHQGGQNTMFLLQMELQLTEKEYMYIFIECLVFKKLIAVENPWLVKMQLHLFNE